MKKAKNRCDYLIVGVRTDELVQSYKNKAPIIPFEHRLEIVSTLKFVDEVIAVTHRDKLQSFFDVGYDVFFVGEDWKGSDIFNSLEKDLEKHSDWLKDIQKKYTNLKEDNVKEILKKEVGRKFELVLQHAGVFKNDEQGKNGIIRFLERGDFL